ncbi:chromosome segregation protein SMC [Archaeoglobus veneficus]|uniref:Chromosome partition protein Smc n=1 Tax=Archaeoglobus veneficus (strain DSM 11195 / SNP6) TaxID=693661 RepID=F2KNS5_ARCVS|nr:chromosome segregation protein SMC [Archaeoglobus veneficus]AEA47402.1 chromosome segregation protein SMC [Archaeoglobus veneficus SNP6]
MHIKKIVIKNFKSFGKKVEIPFYRGFTVISGPNGSGKSNIVDSILFCLGLSTSTKALRAERLTDLVFNSNGKRSGEAEVSIIFDNSDSKLPFEGDVTITRRIRLTDRGHYSYYYINGKSCSLSEIQRLLSDAGIHGDAYNVIMQGDVTRITEMTPLQRRKIIDDIAGISEFDEKKEKAIEELEIVRENIERINAVLVEVNSRLEQLEKDREEALRYRALVEEKDHCNRIILTHRYRGLQAKKKRLENEIERLEAEKDRLTEKIVEVNAGIQTLNSKAQEITAKISEISGPAYARIQERVVEINSEIEAVRKSEELYRKEIARLQDEKTQIALSISKLREELEGCEEELERLAVERISLQSVVDETAARLELVKMRLEEVDAKYRQMRDELLARKEELEKLKEERSELVRTRDRLMDSIRRVEIDISELEKQKERAKSTIEELERKIEDRKNELERLELEAGRQIKLRNEIDSSLFSLRNELSKVEEDIKAREVELAKVRAELAALESGFSRAVELVLEAKERKALPGVYGTVAQLCQVDEAYALALETAAGNALQYIVVENEDDAVRAINYLKQIRGGRATFLPLNRMRKNFGKINLDRKVLSEKGVVDYAVNLINCDNKFRPVFNFVFRDTLVVDTIETARRLMDDRRIVTLDGDLVERSGAMSGGSAERRRGMLLSKELLEKERMLMEEVTVLNSKKAEIIRRLRVEEDRRREAQKAVDEINSRISAIRSEIDVLSQRINEEKEKIADIDVRISERDAERRKAFEELSGLDAEIEKISRRIAEIGSEVEKIEKRLKGSEIPKLSKEYEELKEELSRHRESLMSVEKRIEAADYRREQIKRAIDEKNAAIQRIDEEVSSLKAKIEDGRNRIEELKRELEKLRSEEERVGREVRELRKKRDELLERIKSLEKEKAACEFGITAADEKIKARKEALSGVESEIAAIDVSLLVEGEIPSLDEITARIEEIDRELASFGEVNLKAIQEYEEVRARRDELLERKLRLEKERQEILDRIARYEQMKRDAFYEAFNAINRNFAEVIAKLTDGEGELYLDNDDPFNSGLNIKVRPYGKPVQRIESMSGGEKSLVALALIFAIQMYKPAPFYAFDEVDMFLDGVNVSRVAKLIKERSRDAQFIVVSLRKPMLEMADAIVGVTMGRDNSSTVTGIKMKA